MSDKLGHYEIVDELGRGGMGVVYRATDTRLGRQVAIKELTISNGLPEVERKDTVERFRREAMAAARLSHPAIITVYDYGQDGDRHYMVMELLEGKSLGHHLDRKTVFSFEQVADIGGQICAALDYAHQSGVIHRDIKPDNIMISDNGRVKITDFGVARVKSDLPSMTTTGTTLGTIAYISPEQLCDSRLVDGRSDLFSLGALLYEMLTFRTPFDAGNLGGTILNIMNQPPQPPTELNGAIPPKLEAVVLKALRKNPEERYARAAEMGHALVAALRDERPTAPKIVEPVAQLAESDGCRHCGNAMPSGSRVCPACGRSATAPLSFSVPQAPPARPAGITPPRMPQPVANRVPVMPGVQSPTQPLQPLAPVQPAAVPVGTGSLSDKGIARKVVALSFVQMFGKAGFGQGEFQQPRCVALDPNKNLLVADTENGRIQVFDASGRFLRQFKSNASQESFRFPRAIAINALNIIYITDDLDFRIYKFDLHGRQLAIWKRSRTAEENPAIPGRLLIGPNGTIYLSEPNNHRVLVYDSNERLQATLSGNGLQSPGGMTLDSKGQLCVLDFGSSMVHIFDRKGAPVSTFGRRGNGPGEFSVPRDIAVDRFGNFFVTDTLNHRLQVFSPEGQFVLAFGQKGQGPGEFNGPEGIVVGQDDRVYVTDRGNGRVQIFSIERA